MELASQIPIHDMLIRLGLAVAFGGGLGLERELRGRSAGLRTLMLIALGAATMTIAALEIHYSLIAQHPGTRSDPLRAIEGVMAGVGFLGAGLIIRGSTDVRGLTTAATVWMCGAIGLACGAGYVVLAGIAFGMTLVILTVLRVVTSRVKRDGE